MTPALDAIKDMADRSSRERIKLQHAVMVDGCFYWMGRKVILIYEDTGKPTNAKE